MSDVAPKDGEFFEGKLWFHRKGSLVTVGVTSLGIEQIGEVASVEFPDEGADFQKGEILLTVDGSLGRLEVATPASGIVQEVNEAAKDEPDMVSEDPLEEGWLVKLEIEDTSELKELISES
jgi:glycine cleavage system H protein